MTCPTEIRIDRLVLPASERNRTEAFRTALIQDLAARFGSESAAGARPPLVARTANAVAQRIKGQQP